MSTKLDHFFEEKLKSPELEDDMRYEILRLKSFVLRPNSEKGFAIRFAAAGFYYKGPGNKVKCFVCLIEKENWTDKDQPWEEHKSLNSHCPFLTKEDQTNIPIDSQSIELSDLFTPIKHLFEQQRSFINSELVGPSKQSLFAKVLKKTDTGEQSMSSLSSHESLPLSPSDPAMNRADNLQNLTARSTPEDAQFNAQQTETFRLNLAPGSSSLNSRENLASIVERSSSITATKPEVKPQSLGKVDAGNLKYERHRLETYRTWPMGTPVTAKDLAKNGFYYTGTGDRVQCVFCKGILKDWEVGDKPHIEHKNRFPRCPFILGTNVGNVPVPPPNPTNNPTRQNVSFMNNQPMSNMEALGINTERPKNPQYAVESSRIATFRNWPVYKHQTPEALASAGFFFAGFGDNVKCFYCDGGLRNWEAGDDPWVEHARWFPKCPFALSVKGHDFIKSVQDAFNQGGQRQQPASTAGGHVVEEREIKARMELPLVRTVLSTGVSKASVKKVIEKRLRETGDDFPNAESLLEAVLNMEMQAEEMGVSTPGGAPGHSRTSSSSSLASSGTAAQEHPSSLPLENNQSGPISTRSDPGTRNPQNQNKPTNTPSPANSISQQNDMMTCKICLENEVAIVFLPCGHLCCCVQCAPAVNQCPVCRAPIRGNVRTYIT